MEVFIIIIALYLLWLSYVTKTQSNFLAFLFKILPFLGGLFLIVYVITQIGWLTIKVVK